VVAEVTGIVKRTVTALWMLGYNSGLACLSVLISSKLASLTPERELQVFMPFAGDLPVNNFTAYKAEMVRWKCKWQNVTEKPSTLIDTLKHAKPELFDSFESANDLSVVAEVTGIVKRTFTALWVLGYNSGLACLSVTFPVYSSRFIVFSCSMQSQLNWIVISMYIRIANMLYIFQIKKKNIY
jgi:hypothetical protein